MQLPCRHRPVGAFGAAEPTMERWAIQGRGDGSRVIRQRYGYFVPLPYCVGGSLRTGLILPVASSSRARFRHSTYWTML